MNVELKLFYGSPYTYDAKVIVGKYTSPTNPALGFDDADSGEHLMTASVNVDFDLPPGEIAIKNWSENTGIEATLKTLNLISGDPLYFVRSEFVEIPIYTMTPTLLDLLAKETNHEN